MGKVYEHTHVGELGNEAIHVVIPSVSMLSGTSCRVFCPLKVVLQSQVFFNDQICTLS